VSDASETNREKLGALTYLFDHFGRELSPKTCLISDNLVLSNGSVRFKGHGTGNPLPIIGQHEQSGYIVRRLITCDSNSIPYNQLDQAETMETNPK